MSEIEIKQLDDKLVTVDTIVDFLKEKTENKIPISPSLWVDAAEKINVLLEDDQKKLFDLQQKVAQSKLAFLAEDPKRNVSKARIEVEASDVYREMQIQKAKIGRHQELIRIAKLQARINDTTFKGY